MHTYLHESDFKKPGVPLESAQCYYVHTTLIIMLSQLAIYVHRYPAKNVDKYFKLFLHAYDHTSASLTNFFSANGLHVT